MHDLAPRPGDLDPVETAPVEELRALQLQRLQWSVRHAYDHVAHYRRAFDEAGVGPDDIVTLAEAMAPGGRRTLHSICATDYTPVMEPIADLVRDRVSPACHPECVADVDASTTVLDPACELRQIVPTASGPSTEPAAECIAICGGNVCPPGQRGNATDWQMPAGAEVCDGSGAAATRVSAATSWRVRPTIKVRAPGCVSVCS